MMGNHSRHPLGWRLFDQQGEGAAIVAQLRGLRDDWVATNPPFGRPSSIQPIGEDGPIDGA